MRLGCSENASIDVELLSVQSESRKFDSGVVADCKGLDDAQVIISTYIDRNNHHERKYPLVVSDFDTWR